MMSGSGRGLLVVLAAGLSAACAQGGVPGAADVPDLMAEAAGTKAEPKFGDSDVRRAVRMSFRTMLRFDSTYVATVADRFSRPHLYSYLLESESFVGGDFPRATAALLREVQQADLEYIAGIESFADVLRRRLESTDISAADRRVLESEMADAFGAQHQPVLDAVQKFDRLVVAIAEIYELVARNPSTVRSMRTGLEISDQSVLDQYNALVDRVNAAHDAADAAIKQLKPEQQLRFARMRVVKPVKA